MPPVHFTVSQIRVAASCPRILFFDAEQSRRKGLKTPGLTRIWKSGEGSETSACGSLFHTTIEKFNGDAAANPAVRQLLSTAEGPAVIQQGLLNHIYWNCLNRDSLFGKTGPQQQAFTSALRVYVGELADILAFALKLGRPLDQILGEMFGDKRRRVDVTFHLDPDGDPVHVTGVLDYVFYDWRTSHHRILDYKLTCSQQPSNDVFQVCVYALMHHQQHHTMPDAGVLYLHPERALFEKKWEDVWAERDKVTNLLASMRDWVRYDEQSGMGQKPPGEPVFCGSCRWNDECVQRLGPKEDGKRRKLSLGTASESASLWETPGPPSNTEEEVTEVPAQELWIGRTVLEGRPVGLPCQVLPTHVAVVGAAGSGKTWLAKVLAEEAILQKVPVLAIDPQGDLVQFLRRNEPGILSPEDRRRFERFDELVEPRILTPGSSHGIRVSLSPLGLAAASELAGEQDPHRLAEELEGILATAASNLVNVAKCGGETDSQQTFVLQVLKRLTAEGNSGSLPLATVVAGITRPSELGIDNPDTFVKKSEREKLGRKLNNLMHGPLAHLFTGGVALDVEQLSRPVTPGKVPLNVLYLNALADDDQKQFFVAAMAAEVYRWMVTSTNTVGKPRLLLYLDEARDYIPAGGAKPPAKMPLIRLFAQGRKYGVACLMCTQSPRSVDYNVFGNCSTKIIGRLESTQDADRVAEWFSQSGPAPAWLGARAGSQSGTFVARWPQMAAEFEGQAIKSRVLFSLHEGAWSPDRVEKEMQNDPVRQSFRTGLPANPA